MRYDDAMNLIKRALRPVVTRILGMVLRVVVESTKEDGGLRVLKLAGLGDETLGDVEQLQEYGFTSRPLADCKGVVLFVGGSRDLGLLIATDDRRYRPKMKEGETAVYTYQDAEADEGHHIKLLLDRLIQTRGKNLKSYSEEDHRREASRDEISEITRNREATIGGDDTTRVTGDQMNTVIGNQTNTVTGDHTEAVTGEIAQTGAKNIASTAAVNITNTAGGSILNFVGQSGRFRVYSAGNNQPVFYVYSAGAEVDGALRVTNDITGNKKLTLNDITETHGIAGSLEVGGTITIGGPTGIVISQSGITLGGVPYNHP